MILVRNRLILDFIFNVIKWIIKIVYKIITLINMQLPLLVILVGLVLFLCGVFDGGGLALAIFGICLVVSIVIGLIGLIKKIFGSDDKKETTTTTTQIVETPPTVV